MNQYIITADQPNRHYIDIVFVIDCGEKKERGDGGKPDAERPLLFRLPAWRPGRYELANYARNIQYWRAYNEKGQPLPARKLSKDCWKVSTGDALSVSILYNYYAFEPDAGSSFFDDRQLYVNPVNCLLYVEDRVNEPCSLALRIPAHYRLASGLSFTPERVALTSDYHELADSPIIASPDLQQREYFTGGHHFRVSMQGHCRPDWVKMIRDLGSIATAHIDLFGAMPVREFHFLYHVLPVRAYHGVEHARSCEISFGPGYRIMEQAVYKEFMSISSHELFHCWNIKAIRPKELLPYDYSKESYSHLGYVSEGVTTYYGDLQLLRCGVFSWEDYTARMSGNLTAYFQNEGRHFQTLAESSFDTWLDGYQEGAPDRKVSMYVKGAIIAWLLDLEIRRSTRNARSFDDVMRRLYYEFARAGKGYSEEDYVNLVRECAGDLPIAWFGDFVWGLRPLEHYIPEMAGYIGCTICHGQAENLYERVYGLKCSKEGSGCAGRPVRYMITRIAPESPAEKAGLSPGDEIMALNDSRVADELNDLFIYYQGEEITLTLYRNGILIRTRLAGNGLSYFPTWLLVKSPDASPRQKENFRLWAGQQF